MEYYAREVEVLLFISQSPYLSLRGTYILFEK